VAVFVKFQTRRQVYGKDTNHELKQWNFTIPLLFLRQVFLDFLHMFGTSRKIQKTLTALQVYRVYHPLSSNILYIMRNKMLWCNVFTSADL